MRSFVAIVGRPNVGKSTLFNRLVGQKQAIVDDMPGVTRDKIYADVNVEGAKITLIDTGGYEPGPDDEEGLPALVRRQTLSALEEADLTVLLVDARAGLNPVDRELTDILRRSGRPFLVAAGKVDGPSNEDLLSDFYALGVDEILPVSGAHGYGVRSFLAAVAARLPQDQPGEEAAAEVSVAIIGRPNVGKSSLVNKLTGLNRAVVSDVPGTTRDPLDVVIEREGRRYRLVDTAGIRRKGKTGYGVERFAIIRALRAMERADVALLIIDSVEGITDQDAHVIGYAMERGRGLIIFFNKWDLVTDKKVQERRVKDQMELKLKFLTYIPWLTGSALSGQRVERVFKLIDQVYAQYSSRAGTGQVNQALTRAVEAHTPPYVGQRRLKFYYATQVAAKPPTFVVVTNMPDKIHFSYARYLTNAFREAFGLDMIPIRLKFKHRGDRNEKKEVKRRGRAK